MSALPKRLAALAGALDGIETEAEQRDRGGAQYDWRRLARPAQLAPEGGWTTWVLLGGRGMGKTRAGSEWVRERATGSTSRGAVVCPTAADTRDVAVEGECGLLAVCPPWARPDYEPSKRRLTWRNGSMATLFSADEPDRLRGFSFEWAWCDELSAWRRMRQAWDNLQLCMRKGGRPQVCVTTTPRPVALVGELVGEVRRATGRVVLTSGTVYDNRENLSAQFFSQIVSRYEGTSLAAQELLGQYLDSLPGALWTRDMFRHAPAPGQFRRVVVAVDPATTSGDQSDETGIIAAGVDAEGGGWVLGDHSLRGTPAEWAAAVVRACQEHGAHGIVAEKNSGGEMVEHVLRSTDPNLPAVELVHASKSKGERAEPIALLYEQGKVFHSASADLEELEQQLCLLARGGFFGAGSPDRADAMVHGLTALVIEAAARQYTGGMPGPEHLRVVRRSLPPGMVGAGTPASRLRHIFRG